MNRGHSSEVFRICLQWNLDPEPWTLNLGCPTVLTVLGELGGAGERGDLEAVLGDGDGARVVEAPPRLLLLLLHLQPGGRQTQVHLGVLRLLGVRLATGTQVGGSQSAQGPAGGERLDG